MRNEVSLETDLSKPRTGTSRHLSPARKGGLLDIGKCSMEMRNRRKKRHILNEVSLETN